MLHTSPSTAPTHVEPGCTKMPLSEHDPTATFMIGGQDATAALHVGGSPVNAHVPLAHVISGVPIICMLGSTQEKKQDSPGSRYVQSLHVLTELAAVIGRFVPTHMHGMFCAQEIEICSGGHGSPLPAGSCTMVPV